MDNLLVTGANGHVGYNIAKLLVEKGYNVRASVRDVRDKEKTKHLNKLGVEVIEVDIMNPESLKIAVKNIDGVFQVAAVFKKWAKNPQKEIIEPSVIGGVNVLKAARQACVKKIIYTSGNVAMGSDSSPERIFTEDDWNYTATSPYAFAKTQGEKKAWDFARKNNMDMVSINPSAVIGPGFYRHTGSTELKDANGRYLISEEFLTLEQVLQLIKEFDPDIVIPKKKISLTQLKFFSFIDWCGSLFSGKRTLTSEMINETLGKHAKFSSQKAKDELGWEAMDIKESIEDTVSWVRKQFL